MTNLRTRKLTVRRRWIAAGVATLVAAAAGTTSALALSGEGENPRSATHTRANAASDDNRDDRDRDSDDRDSDDSAAAPKISEQAAVKAALAKVPGATVLGSDLDDDDDSQGINRLVWEVELYSKNKQYRDVTVDAASGKVLANYLDTHEREDDPERGDRAEAAGKTKVSRAEARAIAEKKVPGADVRGTDLDSDNGRLVWEFDLADRANHTEHELSIDATTGKIIEHEQDTLDED